MSDPFDSSPHSSSSLDPFAEHDEHEVAPPFDARPRRQSIDPFDDRVHDASGQHRLRPPDTPVGTPLNLPADDLSSDLFSGSPGISHIKSPPKKRSPPEVPPIRLGPSPSPPSSPQSRPSLQLPTRSSPQRLGGPALGSPGEALQPGGDPAALQADSDSLMGLMSTQFTAVVEGCSNPALLARFDKLMVIAEVSEESTGLCCLRGAPAVFSHVVIS